MEISKENLVKIHYKGTLSDGSVFDSSEGKEPLEFITGIGMVIPGLDSGIEGMKIGDKKTIEIKSMDAYGPVMDTAMQEVPKDQFPPEIKLEVGMQLAAQGPQGVIPVKVAEILEETVKVDFNHPLAGQDLTFEVEIVNVAEATEEDKARILGPMAGGSCSSGSCGDCSDGSCSSKKE